MGLQSKRKKGGFGAWECFESYIGVILGLFWVHGKENGNYYNGESNGKENGK